uniref:POM121 transmembrane nucleoporin n=1 Tax=Monopterus albus TaxID=43700 RepID=A0A3Q3J4P3_MONAL
MGSYIGKPDSPVTDSERLGAGRNPREQLREKLSRPNHAVYTPNRRWVLFKNVYIMHYPDFVPGREPLSTVAGFTITPKRHYPLQQPGVSSVGVLPPVKWDGFRKKNILSPRNSPAALSPVTVKIARPDHSSPSCAGLPRAPPDPCSRESVLRVLKESRKREVEDEDRSFTTEQRSKRRRNDSGGSAHSAFESVLPNGTPSQLVPKPGSLKRGMTSLVEESTMKRSRTSSISSVSVVHAPRGTPCTRRNPIHSSYSSSLGFTQKPSAPSSSLSSPESSRSQTPEGASKRPRYVSAGFPLTKLTSVTKVPVTTSVDSTDSGGKRKRKIQLVSSHRDDCISLPPPPELGYTITVKDLDEEKKAAISKIQKVLEVPGELALLLAPHLLPAQLQVQTRSYIISRASHGSHDISWSFTQYIMTCFSLHHWLVLSLVSASTTQVQPTGLTLKASTAVDAPQFTPASQSQSSTAGLEQPSAFTQVLGQFPKATSGTPPVAGLFGLASQNSTPSASTASNPVTAPGAPASTSKSVSNTNPVLASGFKPIFAITTASSATSTPESKPPVQDFKPIFGGATAGAGFGQPPSLTTINTTPMVSSSSTLIFGGPISSTTSAPSVFPGLSNTTTGIASSSSITTTQPAAQPAVKSLFGNWSTPSTTSTSSASAPNTGSTFQFGTVTTTAAAAPAASTTASSNSTFTFGVGHPDTQDANQKMFAFGQKTKTASFGGFAMSTTTSTTTAAAAAATTQSTFPFGKPSFEAAGAQSTFGSSAAPPKPFTFGSGGASSTPASHPAPPPFAFGAAAATTATTFGTPAKPAFGAGSTGFGFGGTTTPSAAPSFGAVSQAQSSSSAIFTFGSSAAAQPAPSVPAQQASSGFSFGAGMSCPQFGTPVSNNPVPQMGGFNFGAAAADKPVFGSPAAPSFSIGAGSKPSGSRQRLQARRQHNRKK